LFLIPLHPLTNVGSVQFYSWCCPGVSYLWKHTDTSIGPEGSHRKHGEERQSVNEDKIWNGVSCNNISVCIMQCAHWCMWVGE